MPKFTPSSRSAALLPSTPLRNAAGRLWICAAVLALGVILAWSNSFSAPFELDDHGSIVGNTSIRDFWSFHWLKPPATAGETVSGRPVLNFTFAVNYAFGGLEVRGYRVVNVAIHLLSGLVLFGLVRRTLAGFSRAGGADRSNSVERRGDWLALAVAMIWAVHPLQTAAVTYIAQRAESLAGLFYLLTLYCFARAVEPGAASRRWTVATLTACMLGMATKETMSTAPLLVLLYDRAFVAGSLRGAWVARWRLYVGLAASWLLLAVLVLGNPGRGGSAGFGGDISICKYLLTQCDAINRYLALVFWPSAQVFDYGVATATGFTAVLPQFGLLVVLAISAGWALRRNRVLGFLGASFFLLLAPSSSVVPVVTQTMAEHRMYLALSIPVILCCLTVDWLSRRHGSWLAGLSLVLVVAGLGWATIARNLTYRSELMLWQDTVNKCPENPRAHNNLGLALVAAGQTDAAMAAYRRAIELQPNHAFAHFNLAAVLLKQNQWEEAARHLRAALQADPIYVSARVNFARALAQLGRVDEAIGQYQAALALDAGAQDARTNLAALLLDRKRSDEALALLLEALSAEPELAEAHYHLGRALGQKGQVAEAEKSFHEASRLRSDWAEPHLALGNLLLKHDDVTGAERAYRQALALDPKSAEACYALGNILARQKNFEAATSAYRQALEIEPTHVQARNNLGNCQLVMGRFQEAIATYTQVLEMQPDDPAVRRNLELARELLNAK